MEIQHFCNISRSVIDMKEGEMQFITVELIYLIGAKCMEHEVLQWLMLTLKSHLERLICSIKQCWIDAIKKSHKKRLND